MITLLKVDRVLKKAHKALSHKDAITDLAYLVDVDPYGAEALLVYITTDDAQRLDAAAKRQIETEIREALSQVLGYSVYFRWQTNAEVPESGKVATMHDLIIQPHSALRRSI